MTRTPHEAKARRMLIGGLVSIVVGLALWAGMLVPVRSAEAWHGDEHQITLCHRSDSYTNPYVVITVDVSSVQFEGHDGHDGPIFDPSIPRNEKWGDIIPPFDFGDDMVYAGKNWTADGQALLENQCTFPPVTTTSTTEPATTSTTARPTTTSTTEPATTSTTEAPTTSTTEAPTTTEPSTTSTSEVAPTSVVAPTTTGQPTSTVAPTSVEPATTEPGASVLGTSETNTTVLPVTGSAAWLVGLVGTALVVGGWVLVISARRRSAS